MVEQLGQEAILSDTGSTIIVLRRGGILRTFNIVPPPPELSQEDMEMRLHPVGAWQDWVEHG